MKKTLTLTASILGLCFGGTSVAQADYPERPITMLVAYSAGGSTDIAARTLISYIEKYLDGASISVVNRPRAGGEIGFSELARAKPDGYTIGFINAPTVVTLPIQREASYRIEDLNAVANVAYDPNAFSVRTDSDIETLDDLIAYAKAHPGELSYGTTGVGNDDHLAALAFERATGIEMNHITFPGDSDVRAALLGGHIMMANMNVGGVLTDLNEGNIRMLGHMGEERLEEIPDVPTFSEQGYDMVLGAYRGLATPAGVPSEIVDALAEAVDKAMQDPEFRTKAQQQDMLLTYLDAESFDNQIAAQEETFQAIWNEAPWIVE